MDLNESQKLLGVHEGVICGQNERLDELNVRLVDRQFPDSPLAPNIDVRPVQTKYTKFSVLDKHPYSKVESNKFSSYEIKNNFNPGSDKAPVSGYFSNVDLESDLRNQKYGKTQVKGDEFSAVNLLCFSQAVSSHLLEHIRKPTVLIRIRSSGTPPHF